MLLDAVADSRFGEASWGNLLQAERDSRFSGHARLPRGSEQNTVR